MTASVILPARARARMATKRHMRLDCPRDRTPLEEREHEVPGRNVHVDHCPSCEGMFLDAGELERLTGQSNIGTLLTKFTGIDVGSKLVCPACGGLMDDEHLAADGQKVVVEVCLTCKGIWLDGRELDAVRALDDAKFRSLDEAKRGEMAAQDEYDLRTSRGMGRWVMGFVVGARRRFRERR